MMGRGEWNGEMMRGRWVLVFVLIAMLALPSLAGAGSSQNGKGPGDKGQIEPDAGSWRTWVLASGDQLRPPAPPNRVATQKELAELRALETKRDQAALDRIAYWNTGAPAYRWNEILLEEGLDANIGSLMGGRALALMHAAIYDATIAAWDAKYAFDRPRPSEQEGRLAPAIANPASPSYPAEHAVAAGAASEVLAYLFPARADTFRTKAAEAAEAFLVAGIQYRSDVDAGLRLGRDVAALVVERAKQDGSSAQWDGKMPVGPGYWTGQNPALPMLGTWKTWVLASGSEFRPAPPPAYNSPQLAAEMDELRAFQRTPRTNALALFWEWGAGGTRNYWFWGEQLNKKLLEYDLGDNPPRTARAHALMTIAHYDSTVACWDAKYTYWAFRPFQYDASFAPLFSTPNHPSYPSAHSCLSGANAEVLSYLFPRDAASFARLLAQAGEARIWAGLHFRSDIVAGEALAKKVAGKVIEIGRNDGSD